MKHVKNAFESDFFLQIIDRSSKISSNYAMFVLKVESMQY